MSISVVYASLVFLLGISVGSFLNVCIHRIPEGGSVVHPPSHCMSCGHDLKFFDLIPIFSYLFLRGRCRYCKVVISWIYPVVELLTGMLYLFSWLKYGLSFETLFSVIFISILIPVVFIDLKHRIIPDRFVIAGIALVLIRAVYMYTQNALDWKSMLFGALLGGGSLLLVDLTGRLLLKKEAMGHGDVKLMFFAGAFLGLLQTAVALLLAVWIGALVGIIILRVRKDKEDRYMPFGPFLALGCIISLFLGNEIINYYLSLL